MKGHRPAAMTTNGSTGAASVQGRRKREQLPVLVPAVNPVLTPVTPVDNELKSQPDSGWNLCVTRTRRYRSSGSGAVDGVV